MSVRHLISIRNLEKDEVFSLSEPQSNWAVQNEPKYSGALGLLFQQPSLRTMSSFAVAGVSLGLTPISVTTTGGEKNLRDRVVWEDELHQMTLTGSQCVVSRSASPLRSELFSRSKVPILNAGDGTNEHPTQSLIDLAVLRSLNFEGKKVALMGNLRDHRVFHSLLLALRWFPCEISLVAPKELMPERKFWEELSNLKLIAVENQQQVEVVLKEMDFVYVSVLQFYNTLFDFKPTMFKLDFSGAQRFLKPSAKILHPFPRFDELSPDLDYTQYDAYNLQAEAATAVRRRVIDRFLA